jgi:cell wall-associated NlpC family hydrolase
VPVGVICLPRPAQRAYCVYVAHYTARAIYGFARDAGFSPDQAVTMTAIALAESGGRSTAHNPNGEDSRGLWQINLDAHRSWAGGMDLYDPEQNARAAFQISQHGRDVSPWTTAHGSNAPYLRFRNQAQEAAIASGDPPALGVWTGTPGYGVALSAGHSGGGAATVVPVQQAVAEQAATSQAATQQAAPQAHQPGDDDAMHRFLHAALAQSGDAYVFGAETSASDPNPDTFDCSELVQWSAEQAGVDLPDGSWYQYLALQKQGGAISVEEAVHTPGALLFSFSSPPTATGGRPSEAHFAISLGDGKTIEARGTAYGVGSWEASPGRFQYAAVVPQLRPSPGEGFSAATDGAATDGAAGVEGGEKTDADHDGLTGRLERMIGSDTSDLDTDRDGVSDGFEVEKLGTDPLKADSDGDHVPDGVEVALGTNPLAAATTQTLPEPRGATPAGKDSDGDRLSDRLEHLLHTNVNIPDSGNGFVDGLEDQGGFDPTSAADSPLAGLSAGSHDPLTDAGGDESASDGDHHQ